MSNQSFEWVPSPRITDPAGWLADGVYAGIKTYGDEPRRDLGVLVSELECSVGGIFTQNRICGAPVLVTRERAHSGPCRGLIANSGCSNVATGEQGINDARLMARLAADRCELPEHQMLVASTGVIARPLPMDRIQQGIAALQPSIEGGRWFSRAIMTTDTTEKTRAVRFEWNGRTYTLAGTAKGAGMAHPNMATVFCFLTTDARVETTALQAMVRSVGDQTINMVDVDMDTSTSDMMLAFANGAAGGPDLAADPGAWALFSEAALAVCVELAKELARDGEGARTLIEVEVVGARSLQDARIAARTVVSSPLVKTMVTGRDPNLGRVLMALGRSGAELQLDRLSVWIGDHAAFSGGTATQLELGQITKEMDAPEVRLRVDLGMGQYRATAWGCDLTEGYVHVNAHYTT